MLQGPLLKISARLKPCCCSSFFFARIACHSALWAFLVSGTPKLTVNFYEGQTQIGTGTLANGVASFTASSFPAGDVVVSAQCSRDANFTRSASPPNLELNVVQPLRRCRSVKQESSPNVCLLHCTGLRRYSHLFL